MKHSFVKSRARYGGFLQDEEIETGKDYMYCPLNKEPIRVRVTGFSFTPDGQPCVFYWHEVKPDGALEFESQATLGLFRPVFVPKKLPLQKSDALIVYASIHTALLNRPRIPVACRV